MERYALPHGAKGIEGDGFAVEFRADKIVFVPKADSKATRTTRFTRVRTQASSISMQPAMTGKLIVRFSPFEKMTSSACSRKWP